MSDYVTFAEFVSKNDDAQKELEALKPELGNKSEDERIDAFVKFAAKYGFTLTGEDFKPKMRELSLDELEAVAGGRLLEECGWYGFFSCGTVEFFFI